MQFNEKETEFKATHIDYVLGDEEKNVSWNNNNKIFKRISCKEI